MSRAKGRRVMSDKTDKTEDVKFFSVFDGKAGRPESVYLDMQERVQGEILRAKLEGREPDLSDEGKLPAAVGTMVVIEENRVDNQYYSNAARHNYNLEDDVDEMVTLPVNVGEADVQVDLGFAAQVAQERKAQDEALANETANTDRAGRKPEGETDTDLLKGFSANSTDQKV